tara:strand:- start:476 stop:727 length:252 start_codon:yes stop_codon:yes gene_type:complete
MLKKLIICFAFFFAFTLSCSERVDKKTLNNKITNCDQIKNIVTDCLGLHRGAIDYVKNCGDINLEEIKKINSCEEIFEYIENN